MTNITESILSLHINSKRTIAILIDISLCILSVWIALSLRLEELILFKEINEYSILISVIVSIPIFWLCGLYRTIFKYNNLSIITTALTSCFVYGLIFFLIIGAYSIKGIPRSIGIIQPVLLFFMIVITRLVVKYFIYNFSEINNLDRNKKNVIIYGAGVAGQQLAMSLVNSKEFKIVGIVDDDVKLTGQLLFGHKVYSEIQIEKLILNKNVKIVFVAIPSISIKNKNIIIQKLSKYKLIVKSLPSISEIIDGKVTISDIKDFNIDDLLNREQVKPNYDLLRKKIDTKNVLVTGAGGSIGSELCRQIVKLQPKSLILVELNEYSLYKIYEELKILNKSLKIISLLINIQNQSKLEKIFETFKVDTVYHAAAYKHVPLVEENICEGIKNNVYGTLAVARASLIKKVSNLVLISSDKAVRPTNIMGATKRLAELCLQGLYAMNNNSDVNFTIVRFGNVLESSGSVIPKFKKQIKEGGPVTLTHEDVSRYFMTITEASQLVIQACAMSKNSGIFILDMGESVKIKDLIYKMINLSGFSVKDDTNPTGEIEIKIIGLRPGEKLYEELLLGENPEKTNHPKIQKANDPFISYQELENNLINLKKILDNEKADEAKKMLQKLIKSYKSNSEIVDNIHNAQENFRNQLSKVNENSNVVIKFN